jgi:hypothetical protein
MIGQSKTWSSSQVQFNTLLFAALFTSLSHTGAYVNFSSSNLNVKRHILSIGWDALRNKRTGVKFPHTRRKESSKLETLESLLLLHLMISMNACFKGLSGLNSEATCFGNASTLGVNPIQLKVLP